MKLHDWPTRRNPETHRYEVFIPTTQRWVSRQRAFQIKHMLAGHCGCGEPRINATHCAICVLKYRDWNRLNQRKRLRLKPWREGRGYLATAH